MAAIESTIFGYTFKHIELLTEALTAPAYRMQYPNARDNQRLEFLGDAVLGLLAATCVYRSDAKAQEGELTVRRSNMVNTAALCAVAKRHNLAARLRQNRGAAPLPDNAKTLADAVEAVMGAIWLDGGLVAVQEVFANLELATIADGEAWSDNPKGDLQIRAQAMHPPQHPVYTLLKAEGEAHNPTFTVQVKVEGMGDAIGVAHNRKEAEAIAANKLLQAKTS